MENEVLTLQYFANDNYKILKILSDNKVVILEDLIVPLSQQQIADIAHFSKVKTNQILNDLINKGFVDTFEGKRAKYTLTDLGNKVIKLLGEKL